MGGKQLIWFDRLQRIYVNKWPRKFGNGHQQKKVKSRKWGSKGVIIKG